MSTKFCSHKTDIDETEWRSKRNCQDNDSRCWGSFGDRRCFRYWLIPCLLSSIFYCYWNDSIVLHHSSRLSINYFWSFSVLFIIVRSWIINNFLFSSNIENNCFFLKQVFNFIIMACIFTILWEHCFEKCMKHLLLWKLKFVWVMMVTFNG